MVMLVLSTAAFEGGRGQLPLELAISSCSRALLMAFSRSCCVGGLGGGRGTRGGGASRSGGSSGATCRQSTRSMPCQACSLMVPRSRRQFRKMFLLAEVAPPNRSAHQRPKNTIPHDDILVSKTQTYIYTYIHTWYLSKSPCSFVHQLRPEK